MSNLNIVDALDVKSEHNMICLYDKASCDCCICAGIYVDSLVDLGEDPASTLTPKAHLYDSVLKLKAKYYHADSFVNFVNKN